MYVIGSIGAPELRSLPQAIMTLTFFPAARPLRPSGPKDKVLFQTDDVADPGLEHGWNVEVVHGCGDDDFVDGEEFGDEFVGDLEGCLVLVGVGVGSTESTPNLREIDVGNLGCGQIARDGAAADVVGLPLGRKWLPSLREWNPRRAG